MKDMSNEKQLVGQELVDFLMSHFNITLESLAKKLKGFDTKKLSHDNYLGFPALSVLGLTEPIQISFNWDDSEILSYIDDGDTVTSLKEYPTRDLGKSVRELTLDLAKYN